MDAQNPREAQKISPQEAEFRRLRKISFKLDKDARLERTPSGERLIHLSGHTKDGRLVAAQHLVLAHVTDQGLKDSLGRMQAGKNIDLEGKFTAKNGKLVFQAHDSSLIQKHAPAQAPKNRTVARAADLLHGVTAPDHETGPEHLAALQQHGKSALNAAKAVFGEGQLVAKHAYKTAHDQEIHKRSVLDAKNRVVDDPTHAHDPNQKSTGATLSSILAAVAADPLTSPSQATGQNIEPGQMRRQRNKGHGR